MELQLINSELCESRMFNYTRRFATLTGKEIADLLYLNTLMLYLYSMEDPEYADQYAADTVQYGMYNTFNTAASDLYLLAYAVKNPDSNKVRMNEHFFSKRYLKSLQFDHRRHYAFVNRIAKGTVTASFAAEYLLRLQNQLNIDDTDLKSLRRQSLKWQNLPDSSKMYLMRRLQLKHRQIVPFGTNYGHVKKLYGKIVGAQHSGSEPSAANALSKAVGTMAGAAIGRYAGKKVAQATGLEPGPTKTLGTGLGAIAGFWAAGRRSK